MLLPIIVNFKNISIINLLLDPEWVKFKIKKQGQNIKKYLTQLVPAFNIDFLKELEQFDKTIRFNIPNHPVYNSWILFYKKNDQDNFIENIYISKNTIKRSKDKNIKNLSYLYTQKTYIDYNILKTITYFSKNITQTKIYIKGNQIVPYKKITINQNQFYDVLFIPELFNEINKPLNSDYLNFLYQPISNNILDFLETNYYRKIGYQKKLKALIKFIQTAKSSFSEKINITNLNLCDIIFENISRYNDTNYIEAYLEVFIQLEKIYRSLFKLNFAQFEEGES